MQTVAVDELKELYTRIMKCQSMCREMARGRGVIPVPLGFYFSQSEIELPIKVLAVAKIPKHTQQDEKELSGDTSLLDSVEMYLDFAKGLFTERTSPFHKRLSRYLSKILELPEDEIFKKVAYTTIVKCSLKTSEENLDHNSFAVESCFERFFVREIQLFKPQVILALGKDSEVFLRKHNEQTPPLLGVPNRCIKHLMHPVYPMNNENVKLKEIRKEISECT